MNRTILIVDDDSCSRSIVAFLLRAHGYKVVEAVDGLDGLKAFIENQQNINVVITDFQMPQLDGRQMLTEINKLGSEINTIMITGMASGKADEDAINFPEASVVFSKPFKLDDVMNAFQTLQVAV